MSHFKNLFNLCENCGITYGRKRSPSGKYEQVSQFLARRFCSHPCAIECTGKERAIPFWDRVDKSAGSDGCWPWLGAINKSGYGSYCESGVIRTASRVAYELSRGPIPAGPGYHGFVIMHSCDNRRCCNPAHLSVGTQSDNNDDRDRKRRLFDPDSGMAWSHIARITRAA